MKSAIEDNYNAKCLVCGVVKGTQNALWYHLKSNHKVNMRQGETWAWVDEPVSPKTARKLPDRKVVTAKAGKVMKCKCLICEHEMASNPGMCTHLQVKHGLKMIKGETWDWLPGLTYPAGPLAGRAGKKTPSLAKLAISGLPRPQGQVVTAGVKHIDIPVIVRIPVEINGTGLQLGTPVLMESE